MLHYIYGSDLENFPKLRDTMFRDRAAQFSQRLAWDSVSVDARGYETDEYDAMNPIYIIWELPDGTHGGSMRMMPTVGKTMLNDHFRNLTDGVHIQSPLIWECTRFCISPRADRRATAALVVAAGELMDEFALEHFVGVFFDKMERVFALSAIVPDVLGVSEETDAAGDRIAVGTWEITPACMARNLRRIGVSRETSKAWFHASFNRNLPPMTAEIEFKQCA
ncbi:acyl-homoserine-lactone synthase [uncultured Roseobacter sp.]|uniref:acyl-homoserine-lactone synthase n=1 Tax=uncultured Roseobacter sp. TaxID=114847 RepID=UPI0026059E2D|nr:acyl-homoserine-lactone synthase [uncultured Roseobacter sp.]